MGFGNPSLRRRLLVGLVLVSLGYWAVIALLTVRDSVNKVDELFDLHLAQTALALLRVTDPDDDDPADIPDNTDSTPSLSAIFSPWPHLTDRLARKPDTPGALPQAAGSPQTLRENYERSLRYQVLAGNGALLLRSANAPAAAMTSTDGYSQAADPSGQVWRYFALWDRHREFRIVVAEAHDLRNQLMRGIALQTASPLALGLPVLLLLLWLSIRRGLDPLAVLTRAIKARKPDNLVPLDTAVAPREVRPMVLALNSLLQRVASTLEGERQFTAHAAHELRTPLAALQAHLHVARATPPGPDHEQAMDHLQQGVERAIRLVGQMLALARLDPQQLLPSAPAFDAADTVQAVCAQLAPLALQKDQTLELDMEAELPRVQGQADLLSMLVSNLVDNAIRYTPAGGHIQVAARRGAAGLTIVVQDDGPGIPPTDRLRVFQRFVRLRGEEQPGTGLGLAICQRIAELHRASLQLGEPASGQGLVVTLSLPPIEREAAPAATPALNLGDAGSVASTQGSP
jgi:two-component system sensor histidine kinase QseC